MENDTSNGDKAETKRKERDESPKMEEDEVSKKGEAESPFLVIPENNIEDLEEDMIFRTKKEMIDRLSMMAMKYHFEYNTTRSNKIAYNARYVSLNSSYKFWFTDEHNLIYMSNLL